MEVSKPLVASSLNGQWLGRITRATRPLKMKISGNHQEEISLLIIDTPHSPIVLGHPWIAEHRPQVDWVSARDPGMGPLVFEPLPEEGARPRGHSSEREGPEGVPRPRGRLL